MHIMKTRIVITLVLLFAIAGLTLASTSTIRATDDNGIIGANSQTPDLPSPVCDNIEVPQGNRLALQVYATGVQRYRWDGASWVFVEPVATLYADANYHGKVGIHYGGPTWESNSGSKVVAARLEGCSPDATAIPWLLLQTTSTDGPGIFSRVTYIQRVNTRGGLAPAAPGSTVGAIADVPYTTEYYFYRARN